MIGLLRAAFPGPGERSRPFGWGLLALAVLAPFFFATYGFATRVSSELPWVSSVVFDWERNIPFWPWTIVPYWSIDLFYGIALVACRTRRELGMLIGRLVTVQIISIACFLLFPLRFSFERPRIDGFFGMLFDILMGFDKPFNQAPSLHIGLLVILWITYARHTRGLGRAVVHFWSFLIGLSVLTTWQHHFLDVPTGALAGAFAAWLWPIESPAPWRRLQLSTDRRRLRQAAMYAGGALACIAASLQGGGWLWFLWGGVSLGLVALHHLALGPDGFQKSSGWHSAAAVLLHFPYLVGAWLNSRIWTWRKPLAAPLCDSVWIGRVPSAREARSQGHRSILDLAPEIPGPALPAWRGFPLLDLAIPSHEELEAAADLLEELRRNGQVLVCCALGYSRSAAVAAAWLVRTGRADDAVAAVERLRAARPWIVLGAEHIERIAQVRRIPR